MTRVTLRTHHCITTVNTLRATSGTDGTPRKNDDYNDRAMTHSESPLRHMVRGMHNPQCATTGASSVNVFVRQTTLQLELAMSPFRRIVPVVAILFGLAFATTSLAAQDKVEGKARDRANTARGATNPADDENIRTATGSNVRGATGEPAPDAKAPEGTASRGSTSCKVHYDNRTSLYVATYAEGIFRGDVAPWGDLYTYVIGGQTRLYARAGFTDGSVSTWGPRLVDCPAGGDFQWMLYN